MGLATSSLFNSSVGEDNFLCFSVALPTAVRTFDRAEPVRALFVTASWGWATEVLSASYALFLTDNFYSEIPTDVMMLFLANSIALHF